MSPDLKDIQRAGFTFDFSYERKIKGDAAKSSSSSSGRGSTLQVHACWRCLHARMLLVPPAHDALGGQRFFACLGALRERVFHGCGRWGNALCKVEDPWTSDILKFTEMGFSREEVCMALAAFGADASKDDQARGVFPVSVHPVPMTLRRAPCQASHGEESEDGMRLAGKQLPCRQRVKGWRCAAGAEHPAELGGACARAVHGLLQALPGAAQHGFPCGPGQRRAHAAPERPVCGHRGLPGGSAVTPACSVCTTAPC